MPAVDMEFVYKSAVRVWGCVAGECGACGGGGLCCEPVTNTLSSSGASHLPYTLHTHTSHTHTLHRPLSLHHLSTFSPPSPHPGPIPQVESQ